jgi:hypothetical protein
MGFPALGAAKTSRRRVSEQPVQPSLQPTPLAGRNLILSKSGSQLLKNLTSRAIVAPTPSLPFNIPSPDQVASRHVVCELVVDERGVVM